MGGGNGPCCCHEDIGVGNGRWHYCEDRSRNKSPRCISPQVPPAQPSVQVAAPTLATRVAATICAVTSTVREGEDMGARWATPSTSLPAVSMPKASQTAFAGGAAMSAGGGLTRGVILISPSKAPIPRRAAMAGRPLCRATASRDVVAGRAAGVWPSAIPLAPAEGLVEARATAADRLLVVAVASPDSDAFQAAGGRSASAVVPNPPSASFEKLVSFRPVAVIAGDCLILACPRRKIGKKVDCCTGGM